jgi:DNA-binding CsgD family transcriptional regulator
MPNALAISSPPIVNHEGLRALQNCFDEAWQAIARNVVYENIDTARSKLAAFLIDLARVDQPGSAQFGQTAASLLASRSLAGTRLASLTPRQRQILGHVLAGHPSKNIAADLGISQRTVDNHRAAIMRKTFSKSLPALVRTALTAA